MGIVNYFLKISPVVLSLFFILAGNADAGYIPPCHVVSGVCVPQSYVCTDHGMMLYTGATCPGTQKCCVDAPDTPTPANTVTPAVTPLPVQPCEEEEECDGYNACPTGCEGESYWCNLATGFCNYTCSDCDGDVCTCGWDGWSVMVNGYCTRRCKCDPQVYQISTDPGECAGYTETPVGGLTDTPYIPPGCTVFAPANPQIAGMTNSGGNYSAALTWTAGSGGTFQLIRVGSVRTEVETGCPGGVGPGLGCVVAQTLASGVNSFNTGFVLVPGVHANHDIEEFDELTHTSIN